MHANYSFFLKYGHFANPDSLRNAHSTLITRIKVHVHILKHNLQIVATETISLLYRPRDCDRKLLFLWQQWNGKDS